VHLTSHADKQECLLHMLRKLYAFVQVGPHHTCTNDSLRKQSGRDLLAVR
jgi:hypothetical protein